MHRRRLLPALVVALTVMGALVACGTAADAPDVAHDRSLAAVEDVAVSAQVAGDPLLTSDSPWYVLDDDSDPARGSTDTLRWTRAGYALTGWRVATGPLGFKDGKIADLGGGHTPRSLLRHRTSGSSAAIPTYHLRRTFDVASSELAGIDRLVASITYDDAVRVYVNGRRVGGLDDAAVPDGVNRRYAGASDTAPKSDTVSIPGDALVAGTNVIAVSLHQAASWSSDVYFDLTSLAPAQAVAGPAPTRLMLNPAADPATAQTFTWLAGGADGSRDAVQVGPAGGGSVRSVAGTSAGATNGDRRPHLSATVDGLTPGTAYRWRAGHESAWSAWQPFTTARRNGSFSFLYFGDAQIGLDSTWPRVTAAAQAKSPNASLAVHIGDLLDQADDETQWQAWYDGLGTQAATREQLLAPGNHEWFGDADMSTWRAGFEFPRNHATTARVGAMADLAEGDSPVARQYAALFAHFSQVARDTTYYTDRSGVRFVALNGNEVDSLMRPANLPACSGAECPGNRVGLAWQRFQAAWLDQVLADSPMKWNVLVLHQPLFSGTNGRDEVWLRDSLRPVIRRHGVDLVLTGHDHVYARGYDNVDRTDTPGVTSGPVYVTANAGPKYYDLVTDPAADKWRLNGATRVRSGNQVTTYQVVDVSSGTLRYRSYLVAKGPASNTSRSPGALYDEFTITKSDAGVTRVTEGWPGSR